MPLVIDRIADDEHFEYKGDVQVTGSIGKNATVIVKDGSLVVAGNVGTGSDVTLTSASSASSVVVTGGSFVVGGSAGRSIHVRGNVENSVKIKSQSADIIVDGAVGSLARLHTQSGDINAGEVSDNASLKTMSGAVRVGNVGVYASLNTMSGNIHAEAVAANTILKTMSGDISVRSADPSASLETMSGDIREGGVKRRKGGAAHSGVTVSSVGGVSFIGGMSGRIIVNGRDITDLVNSTAGASAAAEEPVRYSKK